MPALGFDDAYHLEPCKEDVIRPPLLAVMACRQLSDHQGLPLRRSHTTLVFQALRIHLPECFTELLINEAPGRSLVELDRLARLACVGNRKAELLGGLGPGGGFERHELSKELLAVLLKCGTSRSLRLGGLAMRCDMLVRKRLREGRLFGGLQGTSLCRRLLCKLRFCRLFRLLDGALGGLELLLLGFHFPTGALQILVHHRACPLGLRRRDEWAWVKPSVVAEAPLKPHRPFSGPPTLVKGFGVGTCAVVHGLVAGFA